MSKRADDLKANIKFFKEKIEDNKKWRKTAESHIVFLEELQTNARYTVFLHWIVTSFLEKQITLSIEWRDRCESAIKDNEYHMLKLEVELLKLKGKK